MKILREKGWDKRTKREKIEGLRFLLQLFLDKKGRWRERKEK